MAVAARRRCEGDYHMTIVQHLTTVRAACQWHVAIAIIKGRDCV